MATKKEITPKDMKKVIDNLPADLTKEMSSLLIGYLELHKDDLPSSAKKKLRKIGKK